MNDMVLCCVSIITLFALITLLDWIWEKYQLNKKK